jgi:hypothetical protein
MSRKVCITIRIFLYLALPMLLLSLGYITWRNQLAFPDQVIRKVMSGVPIGTTRSTAEAWARQSFKFIPTYYSASDTNVYRAPPTNLFHRAGLPENVPGGVVLCSARPGDPIGRAWDSWRANHVWVFLLLDRDGRVQDYRFLSFAELAKME